MSVSQQTQAAWLVFKWDQLYTLTDVSLTKKCYYMIISERPKIWEATNKPAWELFQEQFEPLLKAHWRRLNSLAENWFYKKPNTATEVDGFQEKQQAASF